MISDAKLRDIGADCCDYPRDFVTQHRRYRKDVMTGEQQVGVTEPGSLHIDQHFAPYRPGDVDVFQLESLSERVEDQRLHLPPPEIGPAIHRVSSTVPVPFIKLTVVVYIVNMYGHAVDQLGGAA